MFQSILHGFGAGSIALLLIRVTLGLFYVLARFRFFYDPSKRSDGPIGFREGGYIRYGNQRWLNKARHDSLSAKMTACGFKWQPNLVAWIVATIEVGGGLLLIVGLYPALMAWLLFGVTAFASMCTWKHKVFVEQNPVDRIDVCSCYLWRVEGLYLIMAACVILGGGGALALSDYL